MGGLVLAIGDSGVCVQENNTYKLFPKQVQESINSDYSKVKFLNKGINGLTSTAMVSNTHWWKDLSPDLIICTIGANDAVDNGGGAAVSVSDYQTNLETIYQTFLQMNPQVSILFCSAWNANLEKEGQLRPNAAAYITALQSFCTSKSLTYADLSEAWGVTEWDTYTYDDIHPNEDGSLLLHNIVYPIAEDIASSWLSTL